MCHGLAFGLFVFSGDACVHFHCVQLRPLWESNGLTVAVAVLSAEICRPCCGRMGIRMLCPCGPITPAPHVAPNTQWRSVPAREAEVGATPLAKDAAPSSAAVSTTATPEEAGAEQEEAEDLPTGRLARERCDCDRAPQRWQQHLRFQSRRREDRCEHEGGSRASAAAAKAFVCPTDVFGHAWRARQERICPMVHGPSCPGYRIADGGWLPTSGTRRRRAPCRLMPIQN